MSASDNGAQDVLVEIAQLEQELIAVGARIEELELELSPGSVLHEYPPPARNRGTWLWRLYFLLLIGSVVFGGECWWFHHRLVSAPFRELMRSQASARWTHREGRSARGRCELWSSDLGMAEIECDGRMIYSGLGVTDEDGTFSSFDFMAEDSTPETHVRIASDRATVETARRHGKRASHREKLVIELDRAPE